MRQEKKLSSAPSKEMMDLFFESPSSNKNIKSIFHARIQIQDWKGWDGRKDTEPISSDTVDGLEAVRLRYPPHRHGVVIQ